MPPNYRLFEAQVTHPEHSEEILEHLQTSGGVLALGLGALFFAGAVVETVSNHPVKAYVEAVAAAVNIAIGRTTLDKDTH